MNRFIKPRVVISKCIEFDSCRWNGYMITSPFVDKLKSMVDFIPVCPEVEIGLGIPRKPIRLVVQNEQMKLLQNETEKDCTKSMKDFSLSFLSTLENIDGFILKDRSPSCGTKDVKLYPAMGKVSPIAGNGTGLFATEVVNKYPDLAIENEGRLNSFTLREHFLTKLFLISSFRNIKNTTKIKDLIDFQGKNKLLLMGYNQTLLRKLGRIVAHGEKNHMPELLKEYESLLLKAFARPPKYTSNINVLMHALGYFSKKLTSAEKAFFLDMLEKYRNRVVPLSSCNAIIKSWIIKYEEKYLEQQTFFDPYPEELIEITDSGKGRGQ